MARPSNREARRQQILDGFQKVLATNGYERASTQRIAQAAGMTSGLIHYHFSSKLQILLELVAVMGSQLEERFQRMRRQSRTPEDSLAAFIDSRLAVGDDSSPQWVACWVTIGTEALRIPEVGQVYRDLMIVQHQQLLDIVQEIATNESDPKEAATAILGAIEGCYQIAAAVPEIAPAGFAARSVRSMSEGLLHCKLPS